MRLIIRDEVEKMQVVRIATVDSWDRVNLDCFVTFIEAPAVVVKVNMGAVQPRVVGQKCRVERYGKDWFLTHMIDQGAYYAAS